MTDKTDIKKKKILPCWFYNQNVKFVQHAVI